MIHVNFRDPHPIYEQIKREIQRLIVTGALPAGSRLPSVRELAAQLAINPNTIQRAYRELEEEGYSVTVSGRGSFVAESDAIAQQHRQAAEKQFLASVQELVSLGYDSSSLTALIEKYTEGSK